MLVCDQPLVRSTPNSTNRSVVLISIVLTIPTIPTVSARLTVISKNVSIWPISELKLAWASFMLRASKPGWAFSIAAASAVVACGVVSLDVDAGDRVLGLVQHGPRRLDVHDDDDVQDHRAGLIDADDLERLAADPQGVADLLGVALGVGMLAGDLPADHDIRLASVAGLEEPALRRFP